MRKRYKPSRLDSILDIPKEISTNIPKITVFGFEEILVENHKGILEYEEFFIRLNTYIGIININGFNLKLQEMNGDDIIIKGKVDSIDFESTTDGEEED